MRRPVVLLCAALAAVLLLGGCRFDGAYDLPLPGHPVSKGDSFEVTADFDDYYRTQRLIDQNWSTPNWTRSSILNVARMAWFSSDRTIREYAEDIWNVPVA